MGRFSFKGNDSSASSSPFASLGVPLTATHARDGDACKHAVLRERIAVREFLRLGAAVDVDDEQAADGRGALIVLRGAGEHKNAL